MTMSNREKATAAITLVVVLYGVLGLLAKGRLEAWQARREEYRRESRLLDQERKLIAQRQLWEKNYAGVRDLMPVFPADKPVDTHWLGVMDNAAFSNHLAILKRQVAAEKLVGDVYEMAITCTEWDGSLDALVHFLYSLESAGVMLDMRQMFIRPNPADHSRLRGSFVLYSAYMREKPAPVSRPAAPAAKAVAPAAKPAPVAKPVPAATSVPAAKPAVPVAKPSPALPPLPATPSASAVQPVPPPDESPSEETSAAPRRPPRRQK